MSAIEIDLLVVEDNPSDAELILASLIQNNHRIHVVSDGVEALDFMFRRAAFANRHADSLPRLVMLDIKLPKVDGLEVLRALKSDQRTRSVPVVMFTSSKIAHDVGLAYQYGANSFVQKPVEFDRFRQVVHAVGDYWLSTNEQAPKGAFAAPNA